MSASRSNSDLVVELADEFLERYRQGERPSLKEYTDRYPSLSAEIREVFPAMAMMENIALADESLAGAAVPAGESVPPERLRQLGDYRIIRTVGQGGMGIVYEAEQVSLGRHVALKVLPKNLLVDAKHRRRFEREAKAAAKLHHTNIVPVFGVGEHDGLPYYVMQFIQGLGLDEVLDELNRLRDGSAASEGQLRVVRKDLSAADVARSLLTGEFEQAKGADPGPAVDVIDQTVDHHPDGAPGNLPPASSATGRLSDSFALSPSSLVLAQQGGQTRPANDKQQTYWQSVAGIGVQVARALEYAHQQGVQHRDIKPSNLLLDTRGTVWITDFGLAKAEDQQNLTHPGDILGTLRYMPPESFEGKTDARGDIYALGLTLYEMLAFRPAFGERDRHKLIKQVTHEEPAALGKLNPDVPRDLQTIVHKAIDREPPRRYQSAGEMAADLQRFLDDEPIRARRISGAERLARWCRRNKVVAALTATVAVLLLAGTVLSLLAARHFHRLAEDERAARQDAFDAAHEADLARAKAEQRRGETEVAKEQLRRQLYLSDLNLARQLWDDGNIDRLKEVLDNHRPRAGESDVRGFEWYYWWRATRLELASIDSTGMAPFAYLAVSPDGKTVAACDLTSNIFICDNATKRSLRRLSIPRNQTWFAEQMQRLRQETQPGSEIHWDAFWCPRIAFSRDGTLLLGAGPDNLIRRWDTQTWQPLPPLTAGQTGRHLIALAISPVGPLLAVGDDSGEIVLWDTDAGKSLAALPTQGVITSLAFAPDGATLVAALQNGKFVRVSGWASKNDIKTDIITTQRPDETPYSAEISSVAYSPDGILCATAIVNYRVLLWDTKSWQPVHTFEASGPVGCVAFSPDGKHLAAGTQKSNAVHIWDVETRELRATIKGHSKNVKAIVFAGDGESLWSAGEDGQFKAWELSRCQPFETVSVPISRHSTIAFAADGRTLLMHGDDGAIKQWSFATRAPVAPWDKAEKATDLAFCPDGALLATWAQSHQKLRLWDVAKGTLRSEFAVPNKLRVNWLFASYLLAVARGGSALAWVEQAAEAAPVIVLLNMTNGERMTVDVGQEKTIPPMVNALALSPDGKRMASQHIYMTALWDVSGGQPVLSAVLSYLGPETCLAFSPDGEDLAVGNWNNDIRIVAVKTGELKQRLRGHAGAISSLAFSRDGATLVSGSEDGTLRLWEVRTGELRSTFTGHRGPVISVAISPDGAAVASCSLDQTVRVWRAATEAEVSQKKQEEGQSLKRRGLALIQLGNWKPAAAVLSQSLDLLAPGTWDWHDTAYRLAFLLAYAGETEKYQALCRRTVRDFQQTTNVQIAERTATMCLIAGVQDPEVREQAGRFADFALANIDSAIASKAVFDWLLAFVQHAKGIAEYRRGNYAAALDWFAKSEPGMSKAGNADWVVWCQVTDLLFSAMAAHQLGKTEDSRQWLAEARRLIGTIPRADSTDWLMMDLVRRETEALIGGKDAAPTK